MNWPPAGPKLNWIELVLQVLWIELGQGHMNWKWIGLGNFSDENEFYKVTILEGGDFMILWVTILEGTIL